MQGSPLGKKIVSKLATGNLFLVASTIFWGACWLLEFYFWSQVPFLATRNMNDERQVYKTECNDMTKLHFTMTTHQNTYMYLPNGKVSTGSRLPQFVHGHRKNVLSFWEPVGYWNFVFGHQYHLWSPETF